MSIEALLQPRFYYAENSVSFDAEVLFAFFVFGDSFFELGLMVHILASGKMRTAFCQSPTLRAGLKTPLLTPHVSVLIGAV